MAENNKVKTAATEEAVGILHALATKLFTLKAESILLEAEELEKIDAGYVINVNEVEKIAKFAEANGITARGAAGDAESELGKTLKRLKEKNSKKIVQFTGTDD